MKLLWRSHNYFIYAKIHNTVTVVYDIVENILNEINRVLGAS